MLCLAGHHKHEWVLPFSVPRGSALLEITNKFIIKKGVCQKPQTQTKPPRPCSQGATVPFRANFGGFGPRLYTYYWIEAVRSYYAADLNLLVAGLVNSLDPDRPSNFA